MGINFVCCKRSENINNIIKRTDELSNKEEEVDYLNFDDKNNNALNNDIELMIETELPLDFQHNISLNNTVSNFLSKNIYDDENQQELYADENSQTEEQIIFSIYNLQKGQLAKINEYFKLCNKNGKPRRYDDFNPKGWTKFYQANDPFFIISDVNNIEHNKLKIYNQTDINRMKVYQGDLNLIGERHGFGKFITPYYVLIGMWKNDKFCGWGRESRCNGDTFEGRFENGLINGKGIFMNKMNSKYVGDFKNMKRWGKGKLQTDKIIYEGEFYNNMIHGGGRIKFLKNSVEYIGNFRNNKIDGKGVIKFKNGEKYEVQIKNGEIIQVENDIFENSNMGNNDLLKNKTEIKNDNKIITYINGGNYNENGNYYLKYFQANGQYDYINLNSTNDINNIYIDNNTDTNNEQIQDQDNTPDCLLSTYRNYGFNDTQQTNYNL